MQIHEITFKKRVNEGFMDAVKGIGSIAAGGVNQALGTNIGGTMAGAQVAPGSTAAQSASVQAAQTVVPKIAQQQNSLWTTNLQGMMANQRVQSLKQLDKEELNKALDAQINAMLKGTGINDWMMLPSSVDPGAFGGAGRQAAQKVVTYIDKATDQIVNNTFTADQVTNKIEAANLPAWNQIASMVIQIQNMAQFNSKNPQQKPGSAGTGFSTVQQAQAVINRAGISQAKLAALQTILKSAGPIKTGTLSPSQKNLLQAIGVQLK